VEVKPGKDFREPIKAFIPGDIRPGEYTLIVARKCGSKDGNFKVESKPLKVTIK
jgi:hypothetical protein